MDVLSAIRSYLTRSHRLYVQLSRFSSQNQHGQVLLIVVLTMVVALTVGLSVVSRTISNLNTSKQNEESQRAFQAAESGIDQALKQLQTSGNTPNIAIDLPNNANYEVSYDALDSPFTKMKNGDDVEQVIGHDVWLSDYPNYTDKFTGTVRIFYGDPAKTACASGSGDNTAAALEIVVLTGTDHTNPIFKKYIVDHCSVANRGANIGAGVVVGAVGGTAPDGTGYLRRVDISVSNGLVMKVIPIFNSTPVGVNFLCAVSPCPNVPSQGILITSEGKSGDTVRKIQHFSAYPQIPNEIFPYSIISQ